ncbi:hypothetical protein WJX82_005857 [Trebouxia sp. C0006]
MATERFVISALEASFMKDHDLLGKQDPYVVFELGSEKITTPAIKSGGTNCSWEESFTLIGRNSASDLQATVYNKNTLRADTLLGMATHRILHKVEPGKLKMELTDKKGSNTGEIQFILQASGGRFAQQSGASSGTGSGVGSGAGAATGAGIGAGAASTGSGRGRGVESDEARNTAYEGSTASGARSGATGATGTQGYSSGTTGSAGVTEGVRGLNITDKSGYNTNATMMEGNPICDTKYYTKVEDRPIVKEIKTYVREHHPVEKEFVVETRPTGQEREQTQGRTSEVVDTKSRIVEVTQPDPCGGTPTDAAGAALNPTKGGSSSTGTTGKY